MNFPMLHLKICGLKDPLNIKEVIDLAPNMIGFIFYEGSERTIENGQIFTYIPRTIVKVGVFVDAEYHTVENTIKEYELDAIQLYHDDISRFQCLRSKVKLIKAISVSGEDDIERASLYKEQCDMYLFDAKGNKAGGNGIKFNWQNIYSYKEEAPFMLSGGIDITDVEQIKTIQHPKLFGIDINSKFEIKPGVKDLEKIRSFKKEIYDNNRTTG